MVKPFKSYEEQVAILQSRGMRVDDPERAAQILCSRSYYRLAGYWHSMRRIDPHTGHSLDRFQDGTSFDLVISLYDFDARLRDAVFSEIASIELALRALIGHELGRIDPLIHLNGSLLNATARQPSKAQPTQNAHELWLQKYDMAVKQSREDFVEHHRSHYQAILPIWVAVEVMDWGMLSHLYRFAPNRARNEIACHCGMTAAQLESWLKSLNILRNYAAHHARLFTRVFDIKPKRIDDPRMRPLHEYVSHLFGQLSLIRYLQDQLRLTQRQNLARILDSYPHNPLVPFGRIGAPEEWRTFDLWRD